MRYKYDNLKTLGPQAAHLVTTLYEQNSPIFRLDNVRKIMDIDRDSSINFVRKLVERGLVTRLKPGLFILVPFELGKEREYMGNPFVVAREAVNGKDYYLSHGSAMEIHGMVTQPRLVVYITTLKKRRHFNIMGVDFQFIHSKKDLFFGLTEHWITKQEKVMVSNIEKTIIDGLKHPEYCGGLTEVAKGLWIRQQNIDLNVLIEYVLKINTGAVMRRLGYILELYNIGNQTKLDALRSRLTEMYVKLDPLLPAKGKFIRKWRLQLNVSPEELLTVIRT